MSVVIIVNIITSLSIMLGGLCMKKYAKMPLDHSIGFRTARSLSSDEAWQFANEKCGIAWALTGAVCFVMTAAAVFLFSADSPTHIAVLIILLAAIILSAAWVEIQLKKFQG